MRTIGKLALASVSLLSLATPAFAQEEAPSEGVENVGEIVVSARRRDESLQEVPAVVNAVTAESIQKLNLRKFEDITAVVPGLSLTPNANGIGSESVIRGIRFDVNVSGNNGTIQFYYNDAPISSNAVLQGLFDVGQIEVLRGPQGTLRGRSSPSGSINIGTRRPDMTEVGGVVNGTVTSLDGYNVNGAINVPVIADKLAIRVAGIVSDDNANRVRPVEGASAGLENRTEAARFSVRATPFDDLLRLDFSYQTLNKYSTFYDQVESANLITPTLGASPVTIRARDRDAYRGLPRTGEQNFRIYDWQAQLNLAGQSLIYVGNKTKQGLAAFDPTDDAGLFANQSGTLLYFNGANPAAPQLVTPVQQALYGQPTKTTADSQSHEIRLQNQERIADLVDYVAGYLHYKSSSFTAFEQVISGGGTAPNLTSVIRLPLQRYGTDAEESVFGNVTLHLSDAIELSGGARKIWFRTESGLKSYAVSTGSFVDNAALFRKAKREATIYSASAKYKVNDDLMVYANFGTSWRPDTVAIGGPAVPSARQIEFLGTPPEKSKSYEVGFKSDLFDRKVTLNVTGYLQKFKNYPYRAPGVGVYAIDTARGGVSPFNYVAAVPVEVKGIEGEVTYRPTDRFSLGVVASYADGKIKNGTIPCLDLNNDGKPDAVTTPPTLAQLQADVGTNNIDVCSVSLAANANPKFSASVQSEYSLPVNDAMDAYVRGLYTFQGNSKNDPVNFIDDVKDYGLLNLYTGVRSTEGDWDVSVYAKNVFNTFRVLTRTNGTLTTGRLSGNNYYGVTVTQPREFGITARYAFGSR